MTSRGPWLAFAVVGLISCGSSPTVQVDIEIASDSAGSMQQISAAIEGGTSKGVYFRFDPLKICPTGIDDIDTTAPAVLPSDPSFELGADPSKDQFVINTSKLDTNRVYRVRMIAFDTSGNVTHYGYGDCPISVKYPELNSVTVCFGKQISSRQCFPWVDFVNCNLTPDQEQQCL